MLNDMLTVQEAVQKAKEFGHIAFDVPPGELRLEEVEAGEADGKPAWLITLSMPSVSSLPFSRLAAGQWNGRDYKRFWVGKDSGDVFAVRIREFAAS